jgi:CO dehydrogenase nickel-insertion accessory protein CooC1
MIRDARDALQEPVEVLLVDDDTSYLSVPFVDRLRERGVLTVGMYDPAEADGHGYRHLLSVGVDLALPATTPPEELLDAIAELRPDRVRRTDPRAAGPAGAEAGAGGAHRIVAVGGPSGAGVTEVAVALAQVASRRERVVLVDLDDVHPSVARRLGTAVHPHVLTAIEAVRRERVDVAGEPAVTVEQCLVAPASARLPFAVLAGLASRRDWTLLRPDDAADLVRELAKRWARVVVRVGPELEDLGRWVPRYGVARRCLEQADAVVGVCDGSPLGLLRFLDWLAEAVELVPGGAVDVVLNRVSRSPAQRAELAALLRETAGGRIRSITAVPRDRRVERAAWDARLVASGPFIRALARLPLAAGDRP